MNIIIKLDEDKVRDIRRRHKAGESYQQLATFYSVSKETIKNTVKFYTWKDVV